MPWLQLKIQTTAEYVDTISAMLNLFGAKSVTLLDAADQPILEPAPGSLPVWQDDWIIGLFNESINLEKVLTFLRAQLDEAALLNYSIEHLSDQNWERVWLTYFQPMQFGDHLWICPSACEAPEPDAINVILDPGLAFGTGTHPTTALCLEWLDCNPPIQKTLIDYGCGSGILAIAALKLGAKKAFAIDYDEQALEATQNNATRNAINPDALQIALPEQLPAIQVELLLANILAAPLIELAATFTQRIKPGGQLVLSGILAEQAETVMNAYRATFTFAPPKQKEDWLLLEGTRN